MKTIISAIVIMLSALLQMLGIELTIGEREGLGNAIVVFIGAIMVIYSRYTAKRNLQTGGLLQPTAPGAPIITKLGD